MLRLLPTRYDLCDLSVVQIMSCSKLSYKIYHQINLFYYFDNKNLHASTFVCLILEMNYYLKILTYDYPLLNSFLKYPFSYFLLVCVNNFLFNFIYFI